MDSAVVNALQRGQWSPGNLLSSLYHSLQAFADQSRSAAVPDSDTAGQDHRSNASLEVAEDLRKHTKFPQPPQKIQLLLGPISNPDRLGPASEKVYEPVTSGGVQTKFGQFVGDFVEDDCIDTKSVLM